MGKIRKLAGETILYGLGSIIPRMLNFLLVPLHTIDLFTRAEYGTIAKLYGFVGVLNTLFMFGMETAFFRFATKPGVDPKRIFNYAQTVVILISISLSALFIIFAQPIATALELEQHPELIIWLALILFTDAVVAIPFARLRLEKKAFTFASFKIANVLILIGLNFYFLKVAYDPAINVGYVFLANLIANATYLLFLAPSLLGWRPSFSREITPHMVRYAYPIMLTGVAGMINEMFSRMTLDWWLPENFYRTISNQEAVGIFGACYKYAVLMNLGIQAFRYAAEPFFFSNATDRNSPQLFAKVNHYFIVVGCVVLLAVSLNLDLFRYFIGEDFWMGLNIVPILLLAYLFLGIYYNMSVWFKLTDKTQYGTIITLAGAAITILGNFILIPIYGYTGSAWAALLCYSGMMALCYYLGQKQFPVPYQLVKGGAYILISIGIIQVTAWIQIPNQILATTVHLAIILIFAFAAYWTESRGLRQES